MDSEKKKLLVSFSGGRTSAFMTWWLLRTKSRDDDVIVVFANTGKEREETLQFVHDCDTHFGFNTVWIEAVITSIKGVGVKAKVVSYQTASRKGEPFEQLIQKFGIPNQNAPLCTKELKERAIRAYARSIGWKRYYTAIGIRTDEMDRINYARARKERLLYPFATVVPTRKVDVNAFWHQQSFDLQLKSYEGNCDLCWKKSLRKLMTLAKENPQLADWWREMEVRYGNYVTREKESIQYPIRFYRGNRSIDDIINEALRPFSLATDESKTLPAPDLFTDTEYDKHYNCEESCEAFN